MGLSCWGHELGQQGLNSRAGFLPGNAVFRKGRHRLRHPEKRLVKRLAGTADLAKRFDHRLDRRFAGVCSGRQRINGIGG